MYVTQAKSSQSLNNRVKGELRQCSSNVVRGISGSFSLAAGSFFWYLSAVLGSLDALKLRTVNLAAPVARILVFFGTIIFDWTRDGNAVAFADSATSPNAVEMTAITIARLRFMRKQESCSPQYFLPSTVVLRSS
ncbi:unnamed protein product [Phytophthora lilii]|uniref:Unnamed protein product n=1 Tax=Phytophthora lilii TaxID=2077276 RepID=A0A9W6WUC7_9STRA|nr:unnamed protein product [Phytophthora lilii]